MILATKRQTSGFGAEPQFKKRFFPLVRRAIWQDLKGGATETRVAGVALHRLPQARDLRGLLTYLVLRSEKVDSADYIRDSSEFLQLAQATKNDRP
jgi:hypothetical protein